jgi:hypothetical protein
LIVLGPAQGRGRAVVTMMVIVIDVIIIEELAVIGGIQSAAR